LLVSFSLTHLDPSLCSLSRFFHHHLIPCVLFSFSLFFASGSLHLSVSSVRSCRVLTPLVGTPRLEMKTSVSCWFLSHSLISIPLFVPCPGLLHLSVLSVHWCRVLTPLVGTPRFASSLCVVSLLMLCPNAIGWNTKIPCVHYRDFTASFTVTVDISLFQVQPD
jgi:hypothetical protein